MTTTTETLLEMTLHAYGMRDEIGVSQSGWHTPAELTAVLRQARLVESTASALVPRFDEDNSNILDSRFARSYEDGREIPNQRFAQ